MLHDSQNAYCQANVAIMSTKGAKCHGGFTILLEIQEVSVKVNTNDTIQALLFWDPGATLSLCTHLWAQTYNLPSRPTTVYLKVVNQAHEKIRTPEYRFFLKDNDGNDHEIWAVGLDNITDEIEYCGLENTYSLFPEIDKALLTRPRGPVDILIGMDYHGIHPTSYLSRDHIRITQSKFGTGYILTGATPSTCSRQ